MSSNGLSKDPALAIARLREFMTYNKGEGTFVWAVNRGSRVRPGTPAGASNAEGRVQISVIGKRYYRSHLVWLMEKGEWPSNPIDHLNKDHSDDRISNLCDVSQRVSSIQSIPEDCSQGLYKTSANFVTVVVEIKGKSVPVGSYRSNVVANDVLIACQLMKELLK